VDKFYATSSYPFLQSFEEYRPKAVRAAALIKNRLGVESELMEGNRGEFTVWVGDQQVAQKGWIRFPPDEKILEAGEMLWQLISRDFKLAVDDIETFQARLGMADQ
jgi:hypothetical protein